MIFKQMIGTSRSRHQHVRSVHGFTRGPLKPIEEPFFLVVVKLKKGEGVSLPEKIEVYNHAKVASSPSISHIDEMLREIGYNDEDAHHYPTTYQKDPECIYMDANASETTLYPARIESSVNMMIFVGDTCQ